MSCETMEIYYDSETEIGITLNQSDLSRLEHEALRACLPAAPSFGQSSEREVYLALGRVEGGQRYLDMVDRAQTSHREGQRTRTLFTNITLSKEGYQALQEKSSVSDRIGAFTISIYYSEISQGSLDSSGGTTGSSFLRSA